MDNDMPTPNNRPLARGHNDGPRLPVVLLGSVFLVLFVIAIVGAAWFKQLRNKQVEPPPPVLGQVSAPTFTDATGTSFSLTQLDGRIWVADSIFTRCGGQCPLMTVNMKKLQDWLVKEEQGGVKLVSLTVDPEFDSPEVLQRYATTFKADPTRWHFLTGPRELIYNYIINDFKLGTEETKGQPVAEMFIHSDKFVLIDRNRNIRGYFSGTEDADMEKLKLAITSVSHEADTSPAPTDAPTSSTAPASK
jgi:protein SCO1/2